jgi:hypothetical protein
MSEPGLNTPIWSPTGTSTISQGPELSAPRFNAHADPFAQPIRHRPRDMTYNAFFDFTMNQLPNLSPVPPMHQPQTTFENPYPYSHHRPQVHQSSYSGAYHYQQPQPPVPRRPVFSPNRAVGARSDLNGFTDGDNLPHLPSYSMMQGVPGSPPPQTQGYEGNIAPSYQVAPFLRQQQYAAMDLPPPMRYGGDPSFEAPVPQNSDRPRQFSSFVRRSSLQGSRQHNGNSNNSHRPYDHAERRAARLASAQGRVPEGNTSPPTSGRRSYDSFVRDFSRALHSSDAEEGAARVPPPFRTRRLPREPRLRFSSHVQHHDPNLATPRQIQELKGKLPRRLPSQLAEGVSNTCDICAKDYSSTHVQPCEADEVAVELPCGHVFGEFCIFEWVCIAISGPACCECFAHLHLV